MFDQLPPAVQTAADGVADALVRVGRGVGVLVADDRVLTNAHHVPDEGDVEVRLADGSHVSASVAGRDLDGDLAVLHLDAGDRSPVTTAPEPPQLGQVVVAVTPTSGGVRATVGTVSSVDRGFRGPRGRRIVGAVEHTAPMARGSSGSPVLDLDGRLLALNTHRQEGLYLAQPVGDRLEQAVEQLARGEEPTRRRLGIAIAPARAARRLRAAVGLPERAGLLVRGVEDDSPAAAAGLAQGDLVVSVEGTEVTTPDDLFAALEAGPDSLTLGVLRGADERVVEVTF